MLVLMPPRVSSRVSGFPVATPCLWGKLQKLSFSEVFNCENWRRSRTKCSFFCPHVSRLESLVFPWLRHVYEGSCKTSPFRRFPSRFAWQAWQFQRLITCRKCQTWRKPRTNACFAAPTCLVSSLWFSCGLAVSMGEVTKSLLFEDFQTGCHVVLHGRRGTL